MRGKASFCRFVIIPFPEWPHVHFSTIYTSVLIHILTSDNVKLW
jgi:hypothetical protein